MAEMNTLNDSGYGSPLVKRPCFDENNEHTVHFYFKPKLTKGLNSQTHDELVGAKQKALATVILEKYPKMKVEKLIFRVRMRGQRGLSCIDPFLLPCGSIEPNTEVQTEECEGIYDNVSEKQLQMTILYSKPQSDVVLFFISNSTDDRKKKQSITHIRHKTLHCDEICVVGYRGQTVRQALLQDGRFCNVDRFNVNRKIQGGQGPKVDLNEEVEHFNGYLLQVNVSKASASTDGKCVIKHNNQPTASQSSGAPGSDSVISDAPEKKSRKIPKSALAKKLWEENAVFVFSKNVDDLSTEEMLSEMRDCLQARAWGSLLGPAERSGKQFEKSIARLAKSQFANQHIIARPASFTKKLCNLLDSVGQIQCGTVVATCFLVSKDVIVTNYHVVKKIVKARRASIPGNHREVFVCFDYEEIGDWDSSHKYKLLPFLSIGNIVSEKLDYAFLRLEEEVERKVLGGSVSCLVPDEGKLCIVGHPFGQQKQDELCPILPLHEDRRSLEIERRISEKEKQCQDRPSSCMLSSGSQENNPCIHLYIPSIRKLKDDESVMTYDVGAMFEGSSGAPVLNMNCEIVGLHSSGFRLDDTSTLEVGITFAAIIRDLQRRGYSEFVDERFTNRHEEVPMEWEMEES